MAVAIDVAKLLHQSQQWHLSLACAFHDANLLLIHILNNTLLVRLAEQDKIRAFVFSTFSTCHISWTSQISSACLKTPTLVCFPLHLLASSCLRFKYACDKCESNNSRANHSTQIARNYYALTWSSYSWLVKKWCCLVLWLPPPLLSFTFMELTNESWSEKHDLWQQQQQQQWPFETNHLDLTSLVAHKRTVRHHQPINYFLLTD